jgi:polyamine oxidase
MLFSNGQDVSVSMVQKAGEQFRKLSRQVACEAARTHEDISWTQAIEKIGGIPQDDPEQQAMLNLQIYKSCENYEGARLDYWSAQHWNKVTCLRGGNGDVRGGYGDLIAEAGHGLNVKFGRRVELVVYSTHDDVGHSAGLVHVHCRVTCLEDESEEVYCAPRCVIALPLGVLRAGYVRFEPELPPCKVEAIHTLGISLMDKVELLWHKRWWPSHINSFEIASMDSTPTFHPWPWFYEPAPMRKHPLGWAVLVCYVTGHFAEHVESLSDAEAISHCVATIRSAFPAEDVPFPAEAHVTRWGRDELAHGSWTYFAVGSGPSTVRALREPVGTNGCIAFAGEHTCDGSVRGLDMGTVHGAWLSGELAAKDLTKRIHKKTQDMAVEGQDRWRCRHRHCIDDVIPEIEGYGSGIRVEVTEDPHEIAQELCVDPDMAPNIHRAQQYTGKRGQIVNRSGWGWLHVKFDDGSPSCWWTPYCLWVLNPCADIMIR